MSEVSLINGHDDDMKIELENLKGEHTLSGIEVGEREFKNFWGHKEECGYIKFTLDGITYIAVEDPDDGYRSYMRDLEIVDEDCEIKLPDIKVFCKMREDDKRWNETNEVLEFIDLINCETILAIGTGNTSDYYPYCVLDYYPERMSCNADRNGHIDGCDTCVICGRDIPEGSQVCVICGKTEPRDLVEVVRCKDCKHLIKEKMICTHIRNRIFNTGFTTFSNHFCSYGERKETE